MNSKRELMRAWDEAKRLREELERLNELLDDGNAEFAAVAKEAETNGEAADSLRLELRDARTELEKVKAERDEKQSLADTIQTQFDMAIGQRNDAYELLAEERGEPVVAFGKFVFGQKFVGKLPPVRYTRAELVERLGKVVKMPETMDGHTFVHWYQVTEALDLTEDDFREDGGQG